MDLSKFNYELALKVKYVGPTYQDAPHMLNLFKPDLLVTSILCECFMELPVNAQYACMVRLLAANVIDLNTIQRSLHPIFFR